MNNFEIGKWYFCKYWTSIKAAKFIKIVDGRFYYSEKIQENKHHFKNDWASGYNLEKDYVEVAISEISKFLPDEHPDLIVECDLDKARRLYPIGTKFYPAHTTVETKKYCIITNDQFDVTSSSITALTDESKGYSISPKYGTTILNRNVFYNGKWAEIIKEDDSFLKLEMKKDDWVVRTEEGNWANCVTKGKVYQILELDDSSIYLIDDDGKRDYFSRKFFRLAESHEIPKKVSNEQVFKDDFPERGAYLVENNEKFNLLFNYFKNKHPNLVITKNTKAKYIAWSKNNYWCCIANTANEIYSWKELTTNKINTIKTENVNSVPEYVKLISGWSVKGEYMGEVFELSSLDNLSKFKHGGSKESFRKTINSWIELGLFRIATKEEFDVQQNPKQMEKEDLTGRWLKALVNGNQGTPINKGGFVQIKDMNSEFYEVNLIADGGKYGADPSRTDLWELMPKAFQPLTEEWIPKVGEYIVYDNEELVKVTEVKSIDIHGYWVKHLPTGFSGGGFGWNAYKEKIRKATADEISKNKIMEEEDILEICKRKYSKGMKLQSAANSGSFSGVFTVTKDPIHFRELTKGQTVDYEGSDGYFYYKGKYAEILEYGTGKPFASDILLKEWLENTRKLNLSEGELQKHISSVNCSGAIYVDLKGSDSYQKARILFEQWNNDIGISERQYDDGNLLPIYSSNQSYPSGMVLPTIPADTPYICKHWSEKDSSHFSYKREGFISYGEIVIDGKKYVQCEHQKYQCNKYYCILVEDMDRICNGYIGPAIVTSTGGYATGEYSYSGTNGSAIIKDSKKMSIEDVRSVDIKLCTKKTNNYYKF